MEPHERAMIERAWREYPSMSIISRLSKLGSAYRRARRNADAIRYMNELPAHLQEDIGWSRGPAGGQRSREFPNG